MSELPLYVRRSDLPGWQPEEGVGVSLARKSLWLKKVSREAAFHYVKFLLGARFYSAFSDFQRLKRNGAGVDRPARF